MRAIPMLAALLLLSSPLAAAAAAAKPKPQPVKPAELKKLMADYKSLKGKDDADLYKQQKKFYTAAKKKFIGRPLTVTAVYLALTEFKGKKGSTFQLVAGVNPRKEKQEEKYDFRLQCSLKQKPQLKKKEKYVFSGTIKSLRLSGSVELKRLTFKPAP